MAEVLEVGIGLRNRLTPGLQKAASGITQFANRARSALSGLGRSLFSVRTAIGAIAAAAVAGGLSLYIRQVADLNDNAGKLATRLGLTTEFITEMGFVADRSNIPISAMNVGIQRLTRRLSEFQLTGGKGTAARGFEILGLSEFALQAKDVEELLPRLANAFRDLGDSPDAVLAAFSLFDTEGVGFLQFLKDGATALEDLRKEARAFGRSISTEQAKQAASFNDALTNLTSAASGLGRELASAAIPALTPILRDLTEFVQRNREPIKGFFRDLAELGRDALPKIVSSFERAGSALVAIASPFLEVTKLFQEIKLAIASIGRGLADLEVQFSGPLARTLFGEATARIIESRLPLVKAARSAFEREISEAIDAINRLDEAQRRLARNALDRDAAAARAPAPRRFGLRPPLDFNTRPQTIDTAERLFANRESQRPGGVLADAEFFREIPTSIDEARQATLTWRNQLALDLAPVLVDVGRSFEFGIVSNIAALAEGTKTAKEAFSDMARSILADLASIATRIATNQVLSALLGGVSSAIAGPAPSVNVIEPTYTSHATGGVFTKREGMALLHGPEAIVPLPDGRSIPVEMRGGSAGGVTVEQTVVFNIEAMDAPSFTQRAQAEIAAATPQIADAVASRFAGDRQYRQRFAG